MWEIFSNGLTPYQGMSNAQAREKVDAGSVYYNRPDDLNSMFNNRNLLSILICIDKYVSCVANN
jgi:hypothetical protein